MCRTLTTVLGWAVVTAAAVLAAGCIRVEQKVMLNGDGSVAVQCRYSYAVENEGVLESGAQAIRGWQGRTGEDDGWFTTEAAVRRHFAGTGITVQRYANSVSGGRRQVELQLFAEHGITVLNAGGLGPLRCDRRADGRLRLWAELPVVPARAPGLDEAALKALCQDLYLRLEVCVPGEIMETTAPQRSRTVAAWELDPGKDSSFLRSPPRIECVFDAKNLEWAANVPRTAR